MLRFTVYDKFFGRLGWVTPGSDPRDPAMTDAHVVARFNKPSNATFTVDEDHHLARHLASSGARCLVEYQQSNGEWMRLFSGPVREVTGGDFPPTRTFTVSDDLQVLWELLGWAAPSKAITLQGDDGTHWKSKGPAETVVKALVAANAGRLPYSVTALPNQARGGTISVAVRFVPIADAIFPAVGNAGLGVSLIQKETGAGLELDVYPKRVHTTPISERSGVVRGDTLSYSISAPTVTRVIVGAGGQGQARVFRQYIDSARETEWKTVIEVFRDARDITVTDPTRDAEMLTRANETLAEGAGKSSLSLELVETDYFRFGNAVRLGDVVKIKLADGNIISDTVEEVEIDFSASDGIVVTPKVGDMASDPENPNASLVKAVSLLAKNQRNLNSGV
jgi:hypothetical protein